MTRRYEAKWGCKACSWIGSDGDILRAPSPFHPDHEIIGCPECKDTEGFDELCDEPKCFNHATQGWPSEHGYRRTCGDHGDIRRVQNTTQR